MQEHMHHKPVSDTAELKERVTDRNLAEQKQ